MSIVEVGDDGALHVPAAFLLGTKPHAKFALDVCGDLIVLRPVDAKEPLWKTLSPEQRAAEFLEFAEMPRPPAPDIPIEFLDREHIYE